MVGLDRRSFMLAALAMPMLNERVDADGGMMSPPIGLFVHLSAPLIPADVEVVRTQGHHVPGEGAAAYVHDSLSDGYLAEHRSSTFVAADGRRFRLATGAAVDVRSLGLRMGLARGFASANRQAMMDALRLGVAVSLPAGDIDLVGAGPIDLPTRDGIVIAGRGWATRLVTSDTAFLLPTLSRLEISDLSIEQTRTGGAAIQSFHANLRDVRLLRLRIVMRDQAECRSNCISLVMDGSPPGADGITGLKDLLVEGCWLAPGRMGIEIQNHRAGDESRKLYAYRNVVVRGCTIWKAPAPAGMGVSLTGWGTDCLIGNNRFVACRGPNVEIVGSDRTRVEANVFDGAIGAPIVVSNYRTVTALSVVGNKTAGTPPTIGFALNSVDGADVSRNRLATSGTFVIKGSNMRVHDNVLLGEGTSQIIQLDNARAVTIDHNVLEARGVDPDPRPMVIAFNQSSGCVVRDNRMLRADADPARADRWFWQAPPARGTLVFGNERRGSGRTVHDPIRRP